MKLNNVFANSYTTLAKNLNRNDLLVNTSNDVFKIDSTSYDTEGYLVLALTNLYTGIQLDLHVEADSMQYAYTMRHDSASILRIVTYAKLPEPITHIQPDAINEVWELAMHSYRSRLGTQRIVTAMHDGLTQTTIVTDACTYTAISDNTSALPMEVTVMSNPFNWEF